MSVKSPCIKVCKINSETQYCLGCFRTLREISLWKNLTDDEKQYIIEVCKQRENIIMPAKVGLNGRGKGRAKRGSKKRAKARNNRKK